MNQPLRHLLSRAAAVCLLALLPRPEAAACTNILVAKGATSDGSTMTSYVADSHELYGFLAYKAGGVHAAGEQLDVHDWDTGSYLGKVAQVARTWTMIGQMNERQVSLGETTFGGRPELVNPNGGIDYGTLMQLALQRAATAREAIQVMDELAQQYGYSSEGETFSVGDPHEVWLLEMVGKGPERKGAVWVARRVPDGHLSAHANESRIRTFPLHEPATTLYAKDVISFAREKGWFTGKDEEFSFADTYAPLDGETLRTCEARVWNVFRRAAPSLALPVDFVKGVPGAKPLPLWVKPDRKLGAADVVALLRDHFEGTEFDLNDGVGAGPFALPYRWRPLDWTLDGVNYVNDRSISTQQTGFSVVAQARAGLPDPIGGLQWFGVDDTYSTVYLPIYAGLRQAPPAYAEGVATLNSFSWSSAFWVFNWVANWGYTRFSPMIHDIQLVQQELEGGFFARQPEVEAAARALYAQSPELARDYLTRYSLEQAERTVTRWRKLGEELFVRYLDGNVKDEHGKVTHPPYPEAWYRRIVAESPERYKIVHLPGEPEQEAPPVVGGPPPAAAAAAGATGGKPAAPAPDPHLAGWSFATREGLGALAAAVPADFPFVTEKLLLLPGTAQCGQLPACCLMAREEAPGGKLVVRLPLHAPDKDGGFTGLARCGQPGALVRLPKDEPRLPAVQYGASEE